MTTPKQKEKLRREAEDEYIKTTTPAWQQYLKRLKEIEEMK